MTNRYNSVGMAYLLREAGDRRIMVSTATGEHLIDKQNALSSSEFIPLENGGFINSSNIQGHRFVEVAPTNQDSAEDHRFDPFHTDADHESNRAYQEGLRMALATKIEEQSKGN